MKVSVVLKNMGLSGVFFVAARLFSLLKVSFVWGSYMALFSASNIVTPLAGAFGGLGCSLGVLAIGLFVRLALFKTLSLTFLAYYIPGFFASVYFACPSKIVRLGIPLACLALFILHPVGAQAWLYAALWLIPLAIYPVVEKYTFYTALASTFTAHAVGSVIWIYTAPTTAVFWLALIPVALLERICFACGITCMHAVVHYIISLPIVGKRVARFHTAR